MDMVKKKLADGTEVVLVPRKQLRQRPGMKRFARPAQTPRSATGSKPAPKPPAALDNGDGVELPILGNNRFGDCFYAYLCHAVQIWAAKNNRPVVFDEGAVIRRYEALSGGDNGLDWGDIEPEFMSGVIGPNGPHRALGVAAIDPNDTGSMKDAIYQHGSVAFTLALPDDWIAHHSSPGGLWDATRGVRGDPQNGHAVCLSGWNDKGWLVETWGFKTPITLTPAGVKVCDPEAAVFCGRDWFNEQNVSPNHHTYEDLRTWWVAYGGDPLPEMDPTPEPTPTPGPGNRLTLDSALQPGVYVIGPQGSAGKNDQGDELGRELAPLLQAARERGLTPEQWQAIIAAVMALLQAFGGK